MTAAAYVTKDSGKREQYANGMKRDTQTGKARFDLTIPNGVPYSEQILTRFAELLARGAVKYGDRNWESGWSEEALLRAKSSAMRHLMQWMCGERDEDHAAAVFFNIMQAEYQEYMRPSPDRWTQLVTSKEMKRFEQQVDESIGTATNDRKARIEELKRNRDERKEAKAKAKEPENTTELKPEPVRFQPMTYAELLNLPAGSIVEAIEEPHRRFIKEEISGAWLGLGVGLKYTNAGLVAMFGNKLRAL